MRWYSVVASFSHEALEFQADEATVSLLGGLTLSATFSWEVEGVPHREQRTIAYFSRQQWAAWWEIDARRKKAEAKPEEGKPPKPQEHWRGRLTPRDPPVLP